MIRKLLLVVAVIAMPASAGTVALLGTAPPAGAVATITCTVTATVEFAPPGLSKAGSTTTATTKSTKVAGSALAGSSCDGTHAGTLASETIKTATVVCTGTGTPTSNPACVAGERGYDSWSNYTTGFTSSVRSSLSNVSFTVSGTTYIAHTTAASVLGPTSTGCGTGTTGLGKEVGVKITGKITSPATSPYDGAASTLKVCLGKVSGTHLVAAHPPATVPTFYYQINNASNLIVTSTIDPAHSSLTF